jgi:outer membrane lipoprotein-sorting protein
MMYYYSRKKTFLRLYILMLLPVPVWSQSAAELTKEIETTYLSGEAVSAKFSLGEAGKMTLTVSPHTNKFRLDAKQEVIVSDGATVWNYTKEKKQVVIDVAGGAKRKEAMSISALFTFSNNYSSSLASSRKNNYELVLTPLDPVKKIFDKMEISSMTFSLERKGKLLKIKNISANSRGIKTKLGSIKISPIKKIDAATFTFIPPKGVKITDLRD